MTAPRMRRDMSYRKPAPVYEPTPPPSPAGLSSPPVANELPSVCLHPIALVFERPLTAYSAFKEANPE